MKICQEKMLDVIKVVTEDEQFQGHPDICTTEGIKQYFEYNSCATCLNYDESTIRRRVNQKIGQIDSTLNK